MCSIRSRRPALQRSPLLPMNGQDEQLENYTRYVLWNTVQDGDGIITVSVGEYVKIGSKEMRLTRYQTRRNKC